MLNVTRQVVHLRDGVASSRHDHQAGSIRNTLTASASVTTYGLLRWNDMIKTKAGGRSQTVLSDRNYIARTASAAHVAAREMP